jgi:rhodanese-related sulfurtransferase
MTTQRVGPGGIPTVSAAAAMERQGGQPPALLVDVREMNEFVELRVEGAALMPLSEFGWRFEELTRDRPLLMLCRSGARSSRATAFLLQQGYQDVANIDGGMIAWKGAGLPTRSGPLDPGEGDL